MAETKKNTRVAICVSTYRRPKGLERLLSALGDLEFRGSPPGIVIIVVGNDADRSSEAVCTRVKEKLRWPVRYCDEPKRGVSSARNTALREALPGNDFIVFTDDDVVPQPYWLDELLATQRTYWADVVTGPVLPRFIEPPPAWVVKGRNFDRRRFPTGRPVKVAFTSNVLARASLFEKTGMRFDERLDLYGGEDDLMFRGFAEAGYRIVWADRALVHEWIPPNRTTVKWVLRRSFRVGNSITFTFLELRPRFSTVLKLLARGVAETVFGAGVLATGPLRGMHAMVGGARHMAYGTGLISAIGGIRYREYASTDGE